MLHLHCCAQVDAFPQMLAQKRKKRSCLLLRSKYLGRILQRNNCHFPFCSMTVGQEMDFADFSLLANQVEEGKDFCWILKVKQIKQFNLFGIECITFSPLLLDWLKCQNQGVFIPVVTIKNVTFLILIRLYQNQHTCILAVCQSFCTLLLLNLNET